MAAESLRCIAAEPMRAYPSHLHPPPRRSKCRAVLQPPSAPAARTSVVEVDGGIGAQQLGGCSRPTKIVVSLPCVVMARLALVLVAVAALLAAGQAAKDSGKSCEGTFVG